MSEHPAMADSLQTPSTYHPRDRSLADGRFVQHDNHHGTFPTDFPSPGHRAPQGHGNPDIANELIRLKARIAALEHHISSSKERSVASGLNRHHGPQALAGGTSTFNGCINPASLQFEGGLEKDVGNDDYLLLYPLEPHGHSGSDSSSMNDLGQFNAFSNGGLASPNNYAMDTILNSGTYFSDFGQAPDIQDLNPEATDLEQSGLSFDFDMYSDLNRSPDAPNSPLASPAQIAPGPATPAMASPTSARVTCMDCGKVFKRERDLKRHQRKHDPLAGRLSCTFPGCPRVGNKGFLRSDKLTEHRRNNGH